jgi:hypothetical protein
VNTRRLLPPSGHQLAVVVSDSVLLERGRACSFALCSLVCLSTRPGGTHFSLFLICLLAAAAISFSIFYPIVGAQLPTFEKKATSALAPASYLVASPGPVPMPHCHARAVASIEESVLGAPVFGVCVDPKQQEPEAGPPNPRAPGHCFCPVVPRLAGCLSPNCHRVRAPFSPSALSTLALARLCHVLPEPP